MATWSHKDPFLCCSQAELLLHLIEHDFFSKLDSIDDSAANPDSGEKVSAEAKTNDSTKEDENAATEDEKEAANGKAEEPLVIKPPKCLSWYPDGLAWQLEYSRVAIRQNNTLKKLHNFLVSESESVSTGQVVLVFYFELFVPAIDINEVVWREMLHLCHQLTDNCVLIHCESITPKK